MLIEALVALGALVVSVVFFVLALDFPTIEMDPGGAALVPQTAALLTAAASIVLLGRVGRQLLREYGENGLNPFSVALHKFLAADAAGATARRTAYVIGLSIVYPILIIQLGLEIGTFVYTLVIVLLYQVRVLTAVFLALCLAVGVYLFFIVLMRASAPKGRLTEYLLESFWY